MADDDAAQRGATGTAADAHRAGLEGSVGEPPRREDQPLADTNRAKPRGRPDGADDAAARGDDERMARRALGDDDAAEGRRRRWHRKDGRDRGEYEQ